MTRGRGKSERDNGAEPPQYALPERELVVVASREAALQAGERGVQSTASADVAALNEVLSSEAISLEPLFGPSEQRTRAEAATMSLRSGATVPDLSVYYRVRAEDGRLEALAEKLASAPGIETAYVKPPAEPAAYPVLDALLDREPGDEAEAEAPSTTADFTALQGYLRAAPQGVDADYAAGVAGGRGAGVRVIDIEGAWNFAHEDLGQNQGGVVAGTPINDVGWRNHGTAVVGVIGADANGFGVTGIAPDAHVRAISIFGGLGSSAAIHQAATLLNPGDVILIELHRPGPRFNYQQRLDQRGYIALEWWPDDLDAVRFATAKGVIVVACAGNGGEDFDDALYDTRPANFPASWVNPFNPANPSSLAVFVGAGAPPPGTNNRDHGPDRSRLPFSNYGARIDAQGWGREVVTTGGFQDGPGDLQAGAEAVWYTAQFSGTSSSGPVVVGSLACLQGILDAAGQQRLTPAGAIQILRTTGSPQQDAPGRPASQRIGNRPDIRAAAAALVASTVQTGIATQFWDEKLAQPPGSPASLWLLVDGAWRKRDDATPHQRLMTQRAFATGGNQVRVWYSGVEIVGLVITGS